MVFWTPYKNSFGLNWCELWLFAITSYSKLTTSFLCRFKAPRISEIKSPCHSLFGALDVYWQWMSGEPAISHISWLDDDSLSFALLGHFLKKHSILTKNTCAAESHFLGLALGFCWQRNLVCKPCTYKFHAPPSRFSLCPTHLHSKRSLTRNFHWGRHLRCLCVLKNFRFWKINSQFYEHILWLTKLTTNQFWE